MQMAPNGSSSPASFLVPVQVSGKHLDVGEALRTRIGDELNAGIGKYFERGGEAEVTLSKDGYGLCCDVTVRLASGQLLQSKGQGGDAHAAFGSALHKIETRVRRYKRRLKNHHQHPGLRGSDETALVTVLRSPDEEEDDWDFAPADAHPPASMVIAETDTPVKTLTVSAAVLELDLTGQPVLLFRHAAHGGLSVVFRRNDGHIGWIDPERMRSNGAAKPGAPS